jgi:hypothetical protein
MRNPQSLATAVSHEAVAIFSYFSMPMILLPMGWKHVSPPSVPILMYVCRRPREEMTFEGDPVPWAVAAPPCQRHLTPIARRAC